MQVPVGNLNATFVLRSEMLSRSTLQTESLTGTAGTLYQFDLSGASADVTLTLPASPSAGQQVGVMLLGASSLYNLITALNSSAFRGGTSDIRYFDLCLAGDTVVFEFIDSTTGWVPVLDRIRPHRAELQRITGAASQTPTVNGGLFTVNFNNIALQVGCGADLTADSITPRRKGIYRADASTLVAGLADQTRVAAYLSVSAVLRAFREGVTSYGATSPAYSGGSVTMEIAKGATLLSRAQVVRSAVSGSPSVDECYFTVREVRD
jgi:hypothetical protein